MITQGTSWSSSKGSLSPASNVTEVLGDGIVLGRKETILGTVVALGFDFERNHNHKTIYFCQGHLYSTDILTTFFFNAYHYFWHLFSVGFLSKKSWKKGLSKHIFITNQVHQVAYLERFLEKPPLIWNVSATKCWCQTSAARMFRLYGTKLLGIRERIFIGQRKDRGR